ncbi:MAG: nucleoside/nucleotide kinase family protein [Eubacteriales bacterium]|nr:nucleoside/nucleotide kinase family protein [Eubacteriales bacterium]
MKLDLMINSIPVQAEYKDDDISEIFIPLLYRLDSLQKEKNGRIIVMLAAPPATGKSTLTKALVRMAEEIPGMQKITVVGMDGYHRYQSYLDTHTMERDGEEILMARVKGCPETFDIEKLTEKIREVREGGACKWPDFDRVKEDPVEDVLTVDSDIVLLEGNYLLLERDSWRDVSKLSDYTISIVADPAFLRSRLVERRLSTGEPLEKAEEFIDFSDMKNINTCLNETMPADLMLRLNTDGGYVVINN